MIRNTDKNLVCQLPGPQRGKYREESVDRNGIYNMIRFGCFQGPPL